MRRHEPAGPGFRRASARLAAFCELLRDEPSELWVTLRGGSMAPEIPSGSRVRLRCDRRPVQPGEVAAYRRGPELVIHRVLGRVLTESGPMLRFQGDANPSPDPDVPEDRVVGRVVEVRPSTPAARLWGAIVLPLRRALWKVRSKGEGRAPARAREGYR